MPSVNKLFLEAFTIEILVDGCTLIVLTAVISELLKLI
jgi:hypothetical protein